MAEALKPIVFRVGNELYGIDIQYVNAIERIRILSVFRMLQAA